MATFGKNEVLLILKDHSGDVGADVNGNFDLSSNWSVIEYEEASPQSVKITLNCKGGRYATITPIIKKWDRIYVELTDSDGNKLKDVFHVRNIKRIMRAGLVKKLILSCPHQSSNYWKRSVYFTGRRISGKEALDEIVTDLSSVDNRGAKDPTIEIPSKDQVNKLGNFLDPNTSNDYIFEGVRLEQAIKKIIDIELQPVEGGGSFEPVYIRFKSKYDHSTGNNLDVIQLQAIPQGFKDNSGSFTNVPSFTVLHPELGGGITKQPHVYSLDSDEEPEQGTNIVGFFNRNAGSYPKELSMWSGAKDVFDAVKDWATGVDYKTGHLVRSGGSTYECISAHTSSGSNTPPNATYWIARTFTKPANWSGATTYVANDLVVHNKIAYKALTGSLNNEPPNFAAWVRVNFVPTVDYSPLTKTRAQDWINALAGAKYAATNNGRTAMIDPNCIIKNSIHPRNIVRLVTTDPTNIPSSHKVDGNIPHAYRCLVVNSSTGAESGTGDFSGNDKNGIAYAGNVAEFQDFDFDGTGEWVVIEQTDDDSEIFEWDECLSWTKNPCTSDYVDSTGACKLLLGGSGTRATTWKKGSYGVSEIPLVGSVGIWIDNKQFECVHSVKWDSVNSRIDCGNEKIIDDDTDSNSAIFIKSKPDDVTRVFPYYVGFNFWSLHPLTSNSIPFGSSPTVGGNVKLPVFDFLNMYKSHEGKVETFGPNIEDYLPIQGWSWIQQFTKNHIIFGTFDTEGDFKFNIWLADRKSNIWVIPMIYKRNTDILSMEGPITKKEPYVGVPGVSAFLAAKEPEIIDVFDPREFLVGGIYTADSFDSQGRYMGARSRFALTNELKLSIDMYRMVKPLVVTNVDEASSKPDRNIEPMQVSNQEIISYSRAKNLLFGIEKLVNFEQRRFRVGRRFINNVAFSDPVYYTNKKMISETTDSKANTVKTVVDKRIISLSKPQGLADGGAKETLELVTRVWP